MKEKIEEIIDKYIDHLGVGKIPDTEWSEDKKQMIEELNTEVQKAVEDGVREFAEWVFDDDTEIFFDSIAIKTLAQEYLSQQKGRSSVKEDK